MLIIPDVKGSKLSDLPVRGRRSVLKEVMVEVGTTWSDKFLARHFRTGAASRYGYKQRKPKYLRRKRRMGDAGLLARGGRVDLVWSGAMEQQVMASRFNVRGFPSRATVNLKGPSYFQMKPLRNNRPHMGEEVTEISNDERQYLKGIAEKKLTKTIKKAVKAMPSKRWANQYSSGIRK
jgi:hypothetical protein